MRVNEVIRSAMKLRIFRPRDVIFPYVGSFLFFRFSCEGTRSRYVGLGEEGRARLACYFGYGTYFGILSSTGSTSVSTFPAALDRINEHIQPIRYRYTSVGVFTTIPLGVVVHLLTSFLYFILCLNTDLFSSLVFPC